MALGTFRQRLAGYWAVSAVRRACRAAVVMPLMFALGSVVIGNGTVALFAGFGSFAMLLMVDFGGPIRVRLQGLATLALTGAVFLVLGTAASGHLWLAAPTMGLLAFAVLFSGVVSSVLAGAGTSLVLAAILAISVPGPLASIPDRLAGWGLAAAAALLATGLLWPAASDDPLRVGAAKACLAVATRLRAEADDPAGCGAEADTAAQVVDSLHRTFLATPYRPTGLGTSARTLVRLVDEINLLGVILGATPLAAGNDSDAVDAVRRAAADALERSADLLHHPASSDDLQRAALAQLHAAIENLEHRATLSFPAATPAEGFVTALEPGFRAEELAFVVSLIADNVARTAGADRRNWWQRLLGGEPDVVAALPGARRRAPRSGAPLRSWRRRMPQDTAWATARARAAAHLERHSVWLHNSVRGAIGLALAVVVADLSGVAHSFWVVFGTLSVLRSTALSTGQTVLRGVGGTAVGFAAGAVLLWLVGTDRGMLWALLPVAILFAGAAPALISFAAGQAGFTVTLLILFNLISPEGWRIGLVRVEDVALGCAVSLVVGALFWPRGAAAALRTAISEAYTDSSHYLDQAVEFAAARCGSISVDPSGVTTAADSAAAASRRLDDALRTYLTERGPKHVPLGELMTLVTGVAVLRLAADAVLELWRQDDTAPGDRAAVRAELVKRSAAVTGWFAALAGALTAHTDVPAPVPADPDADKPLIDAVRHDLAAPDGTATATAVRVIWTADHLDAVRRLQPTIREPAEIAVAAGR